jgi:hypothetical protein
VSDLTRAAYGGIAEQLAADAGATLGQMMGMPTLYIGGKAFAGLFGDAMIFKLEGAVHAAALALPGAKLFDPSGRGRPMKAWVVVPVAEASAWPGFAGAALEAVRAKG